MDSVDEFHSTYVYVGNDPVNSTDPDGMAEKPTEAKQSDPFIINFLSIPKFIVDIDSYTNLSLTGDNNVSVSDRLGFDIGMAGTVNSGLQYAALTNPGRINAVNFYGEAFAMSSSKIGSVTKFAS